MNINFSANGKCYRCNPDRGADCGYGWLWSSGFSEGNVGWWYREIACGGEGGSNDCPDISLLQKKSVLEKDSESSGEDISYEIWKNKTQFFYDALGRKTKASPTRRYLFAPKKYTILDTKKSNYIESGLLRVMPDGKECGVLKKITV